MLKNMSVGRKIAFGFGLVIILIAIILGVTVYTSLTRNSQLKTVDTMSGLQQEANNLVDDVNAARIELRTVFTSINNDAESQLAMSYLKAGLDRIDVLEQYLDNLDGYSSDLVKSLPAVNNQLRQYLNVVITDLGEINASDTEVSETVAAMMEEGTSMMESINYMQGLALTVIHNSAAGNPGVVSDYLDNLLDPLLNINKLVSDMRILNRNLMLNQDLSVIPELDALVVQIEDAIAATRGYATTDAGRQGFDQLETALSNYIIAIHEVETSIIESDDIIADARATLDEMTATIIGGVDAISVETTQLIDSAVSTSMSTMIVLSIIVLVAIAIAIFTGVILTRLITRPIKMMQEVMIQAGEIGDLDFSEDVRNAVLKEAQNKDEIGQSLGVFASFIDRIVYISGELKTIATGDLTHEITKLSEKDTLGNSLENMSKQLNDIFTEINTVAAQVSVGATQIADGAQSLAQGATEQASTVEEISASINEINNQANESASTAERVAAESQNIGNIAEEGGQRMANLMEAVEQINSASQSIGQVIKAIDDIAFQTNILALNAAVEAARAGQHGKGFAVVADEVRSLAGKSAEAASETAQLISDNIEKAELGLTIAQSTSESLSSIVEAVRGSVDSIQLIAEQSQGSQMATAQVSTAVSQVAQVVQTNSAASEESAAASEEMSGQADSLRELVARFKLKGQTKHSYSSPRKTTAPAAVVEPVKAAASNELADEHFVDTADDSDNKYF